ncbi:unnamed protein product [Pieris macdunnoughi]|uniref:Cytidyltransferase-like domain-containing protein n=1 Tax=Pieris macdunnoughi TaxID=345717 RepID=A0A821X107_9NEOP|nr:unnamed protein product [Pieris macdunnoughi]
MCNSLLSFAIAVVLLSISFSYYFTKMNSNTDLMASNALLFVSNTAKSLKLCLKSSRLVKNILYIKYIGVDNNLSVINKQIIDIYSKTATQNANLDIRLILKPLEGLKKLQTNHPIDMILTDTRIENQNLKKLVSNIRPGCQLQTIETENEIESMKGEPVKTYEYVALGGTFDRLHNGHKILLSQAALRATKHVTVGVTDVNMIQSKILWELIQPVEVRIKAVKDFLTDINPDLEYNVLAIQDLYGPTKDDPRFETKSPEDGDTGGETPPGNGSIFTMTLKNNHLIVETEERNDITKNGRATKMKYSPDNDGIFVVEVQQSNSYRPNNKNLQNSHIQDPQISTNQALIHRVPDEYEKRIVEDDSERSSEKFDRQLALSSTGLSISDLSMSSMGSHNVTYSYSSQIGYEQGPFGYPIYPGYDVSKDDTAESLIHDSSQEPLIGKTPTDPDKPVVTAAIFKQDSVISNDLLQGPIYCIEGSSDGPLLSDVQAREISLQKIHDKKEKNMENGVAVAVAEKFESPIKIFTRFDSVANPDVNIKETNTADIPKDILKGKRASLPVIRTEMYESVKDVIQAGSPKFERLNNDMSPGEVFYDTPPMITITEESESKPEDTS